MRPILHFLGITVFALALATPAHAVSDQVKCDTNKGAAIGKLFAKVVKCHTKSFANTDPDFDVGACVDEAEAKCVAKFDKSDEKFAPECITEGNGASLCGDAVNQATFFWQQL
jgi:hypothetical protein